MRWFGIILFIFFQSLASEEFDCIVIGTSPISLFEALYKHYSGKRVLILEQSAECGGAWKSIHIFNIPNIDMGCHEISSTPMLNQFLEEYAGCNIIACHGNYYFSQ